MQPVKPSWKKLESYLVVLLCGGMMYMLHQLLVTPPGAIANLPQPYAGMIAALLPICATALLGFFTKLRHDAYADAGIPEPAAELPSDQKVTPAGGTPAVKALALVALAACLFGATRSEAQQLKYGLSAPMLEVRPGLSSPLPLAPGIGFQAGFDFKRWSLEGAVFGNALQLLSGNQAQSGAEVSASVYGCYPGIGLCAGPLFVLAGPDGGVLSGFTWKRSVGMVFSIDCGGYLAKLISTWNTPVALQTTEQSFPAPAPSPAPTHPF